MPCERPKEQLYLYLDGELDLPEVREVEQHLQACLACQQEARLHQRLQALLNTALVEEEVPEPLWTSIQQQLSQETLRDLQPTGDRRTRRRLWRGFGAVVALVLMAFAVRLWFSMPQAPVVQEIVDSQIRTRLMGISYTTIGAEPQAIRQWFQDKVEFAVLVPQFPPERYTFLGVRVNYFLDRRVAELAYATDTHRLSLVMLLQQDLALTALPTVREDEHTFYVQRYKGYTTVLWQDGDVLCGLVSDLPRQALLAIAHQVTRHARSS